MADEDFPAASAGLTSVADAAALIAAVATLVSGSTATIMARLDENARGATVRWQLHDDELTKNTSRVVTRFDSVEKSLLIVEKSLEQHLDGHHDNDVAMDARVRPVRDGVRWVSDHWKTVGLIVALFAGWFVVVADHIPRLY